MFALLSPRLWLAAALVAALAFSHFTVYRAGKNNARTEWMAATATANQEARALENARQRRADEAAKLAAARTNSLAADNRRARSELDRLRDTIGTPQPASAQSCAAADQRADALGKLLIESGELLTELARAADAHASDVRLLLDAWPR
jgi:hypothetical protein